VIYHTPAISYDEAWV